MAIRRSGRQKNQRLEHYIRDSERRQQNILWPDSRAGGRAADNFLWNGSRHPTMVQRTGGVIIGGGLSCLGLELMSYSITGRSLLVGLIATVFCYAGLRITFMAIRPRKRRNGGLE